MKKILWNLSSTNKRNYETITLLKSLKEKYDEFEHYIYGDDNINIEGIEKYDNREVDIVINNSPDGAIIKDNSKIITKVDSLSDINKLSMDSNTLICNNQYIKSCIDGTLQINTKLIKEPVDIELFNEKRKDKSKPRIVYNFPTHKDENYKNAFDKFIDVIRHLNERVGFGVEVLFIGNEQEIDNIEQIFSNMDNINIVQKNNLTYEEYIDELWNGEVIVSTFDEDIDVDWSREIVDGIFTNNAILVPNKGIFEDVTDNSFKWKHNGDIMEISNKLLGLISNVYSIEQNCTESKRLYINKYSNERIVSDFYNLLKE